MCTAITFKGNDFYFGRNLDWENDCGGKIVVCPRKYPFVFRNGKQMKEHYAIIGVAALAAGYPLYFDAVNECGVGIAGLNFPHYAKYQPYDKRKENIAPFELIPWLLGQCSNTAQLRTALEALEIWDIPFSDSIPTSPLHWLIADRDGCMTLEATKSGLHIYENPFGVLTNSPPFPYHSAYINHFLTLTGKTPVNTFAPQLDLEPFSFGMGAIGLPGDLSSPSRFVRANFTKWNSPPTSGDTEALIQCFHILSSVEQQKGVTQFPSGGYEYTVYSSCCNASKGIYYYTTYGSYCIHGVDMHKCDLDGTKLVEYPLSHNSRIMIQN